MLRKEITDAPRCNSCKEPVGLAWCARIDPLAELPLMIFASIVLSFGSVSSSQTSSSARLRFSTANATEAC